ncbi:MAG: translocation/assembly module TamB domain-containing protein [Pseudomonadota bacterium]
MVRRFAILALVLGGFAAIGVFLSMPALGQLNPDEERSRFLAFVEEQLSGPGRIIRISGIEGALSSDARIRRISIADDEGAWFVIEDAAIQWNRSALFRGELDIESLQAARIAWSRMPAAQDEAPSVEARSIEIPDLPVEIAIDEVVVEQFELGEPLFGLEAVLQAQGSFALADGSLQTVLDIVRLDGPGGTLALEAQYANGGELALSMLIQEPEDGVIANILNIDRRPPLSLSVQGEGTLDALVGSLALDADENRILDGDLVIEATDDGRAFGAEIDGPIAQLIAPAYRVFFGDEVRLSAHGEVLDGGGLRLDRLDLDSGALTLLAGARTTADGFLEGLYLDANLEPEAGNTVLLPVAGAETRIGGGALEVRYGSLAGNLGRPGAWSANGAFRSFRSGTLSAEQLDLEFGGDTAALADPEARSLSFAGNAIARGLQAADPGLSDILGQALVVALDGSWRAGEPVLIDGLRLDGAAFDALARGQISGTQFEGSLELDANRLAALGALIDQHIVGSLALKADGTLDALTGGFDLTIDGTGDRLGIGIDSVDALLTGTTRMTGAVARTSQGIDARQLSVANNQLAMLVDGSIGVEASDLTLEGSIANLRALSPDVSGRASVDAHLSRSEGEPLSVLASLAVPSGRLAGRNLENARLVLSGDQNEGTFDGQFEAEARLDDARLSGSGDLRVDEDVRALSNLLVDADGAQITGELQQIISSSLLTGEIALNATDIQTLAALALIDGRGAMNARASFAPDTGSQRITASGSARNVVLDATRLGSASFDVVVLDAFGSPEVTGTLDARSLAASGATVASLSADAQAGGAFVARADGISAPQLTAAGLSGAQVNARGRMFDGGVELSSVQLRADQGIAIDASGRVPFAGSGLNVDVTGSAPLAFARRFLDRPGLQIDGTAALDATVRGSLSAPSVTGRVAAQGASIADGLTGVRLRGVRFVARLAGDTVVIEDAGADVPSGGSLALNGQIGLSNGLPADLRLAMRDFRHTNGSFIVATASGDLALTGPLQSSPLLSGTISIAQADIQIPSSFASASGFVEVAHRNAPERVRRTFERAQETGRSNTASGPAIRLDLTVNAPRRIFVRGRGVDAELGGSVRVTGSANQVVPVGAFELIRGRIDILQQRIALDEGSITLIGDLDPFLNVRARTDSDSIDVLITVSGRVSDPQITLSSQPELPQDEVLSRLIYDRGLNELSPVQLAQLALAAAQLAGETEGSALGDLRDGLGLSDIDVGTDDAGNPAVRAGQYVQENVYIGVEASTAGSARTTINLDVTDDLTVRGGVGTDGQSTLGVFFERDY